MTTLGRYRHYKGHLYEVLGHAKHSETTEVLGVAYIRLDASEPIVWVRPEAMFDETVVVDGVPQPRFLKVSSETWRAMEKRVADLERQLHEPGYVDALRGGV